MENEKDQTLWRIAQQRAAFRRKLYSFFVMSIFFWAIWWFTQGRVQGFRGWPWPAIVMLVWGLGLSFQYFRAYHGNESDLAEQEYEKLKRRNQL
jgi:hypothetical protein